MGILNKKFRKQLKGSVLLTVVCVMFVMLIIVTATLTLAANASNRAFADYQKNQATYTARSVINKTIETLQTDANGTGEMTAEIFQYINEVGNKVDLNVNPDEEGRLAGGYGTVNRITLENVGVDSETGYYIAGTGKDIIKITAHVTMGNKTVTYSQFVASSQDNNNDDDSANGFMATAGNAGATSTGLRVYGSAGSNIANNNRESMEIFKNDGVSLGEKFYNASLYVNSATTFTLNKQEGVSIWGNMSSQNPYYFKSLYSVSTDASKYDAEIKNIPYLFVDDTLAIGNGISVGEDLKPVNIFAGRILKGSNPPFDVRGNIYLYNDVNDPKFNAPTPALPADFTNVPNIDYSTPIDSKVSSEFTKNPTVSFINVNGGSSLLNWYSAGSLIPQHGGNLYSKGSIYINNGGVNLTDAFTIAGDMFVAGDLNVASGYLKVKGRLNVGGTVTGGDRIVDVNDVPITQFKDTTLQFPDNMSKEDITETFVVDKDGNIVDKDDPTAVKYKNGDNKIVKTVEDMRMSYYQDPLTATKLKGTIEAKNFPVAGTLLPSYNDIIKEGTISQDCYIGGDISGQTIYFRQPTDGTSVKAINVVLVNLNARGVKFIVDETDYAVEDNKKAKFRVNFYIANNDIYPTQFETEFGTLNNSITFDNCEITTQAYYDAVNSGSTIELNGAPKDIEPVPYIYIYALPTTALVPKINFNNKCFLAGNIFAPDAELTWKNTRYSGKSVKYYDGVEYTTITTVPVSIIGSAIVGEINEMQNDAAVFVVAKSGSNPGGEDLGVYGWEPIGGFANY